MMTVIQTVLQLLATYMRDLLCIARPRLLTDTAILKLALCNFLIFKRGYVA